MPPANQLPRYGEPIEKWNTYFEKAKRPKTTEQPPSSSGYLEVEGLDYWVTGIEKGQFCALSSLQDLILKRCREHGSAYTADLQAWFSTISTRLTLETKLAEAIENRQWTEAAVIDGELSKLDTHPRVVND